MGLPEEWRLREQRYNLVGAECLGCGAKLFPPRSICPECRGQNLAPFTFSGRGEVYSYSTLYHAPSSYEEYLPYTVALVRLEEGPLVTAQLTDVDPEDVQIGMKVEMVTRKLREEGEEGAIIYGYKFRPRLEA
ncbi:MAG: Zn-ribbon domain-containing OB-fold protein [Anaerolineae bacterium]